MKTSKFLLHAVLFATLLTSLSSCFNNEDPGPLQNQEKEYSLADFNRLDVGDAMEVNVQQGSTFSVKVNGDRRNLDDLNVSKNGSTLRIRYRNDVNRKHETTVWITMPSLSGVAFSGSTEAFISGFTSEEDFDITLSGASDAELEMNAPLMKINLSGASELDIQGTAPALRALVSGASDFRAFDLETDEATVEASGASSIRVFASKKLKATASGASDIRYRGNPTLASSSSGASSISAD
jgi:hypothetical protein